MTIDRIKELEVFLNRNYSKYLKLHDKWFRSDWAANDFTEESFVFFNEITCLKVVNPHVKLLISNIWPIDQNFHNFLLELCSYSLSIKRPDSARYDFERMKFVNWCMIAYWLAWYELVEIELEPLRLLKIPVNKYNLDLRLLALEAKVLEHASWNKIKQENHHRYSPLWQKNFESSALKAKVLHRMLKIAKEFHKYYKISPDRAFRIWRLCILEIREDDRDATLQPSQPKNKLQDGIEKTYKILKSGKNPFEPNEKTKYLYVFFSLTEKILDGKSFPAKKSGAFQGDFWKPFLKGVLKFTQFSEEDSPNRIPYEVKDAQLNRRQGKSLYRVPVLDRERPRSAVTSFRIPGRSIEGKFEVPLPHRAARVFAVEHTSDLSGDDYTP